MSRVYQALRQSELEQGLPPTLFDPDSMLATTAAPPVIVPAGDRLDWEEVRILNPVPSDKNRIVTLTDDNGLGAEKFRLLRARLRNMCEHRQLQKLVITSAVPDDGKSLVAMNLAICLSKHTDQKILLLEGDLRKPMLGKHLGIETLPGLCEWILTDQPVSHFLWRFDSLQLWMLPAGVTRDNSTTMLQSARFLEMYRKLSSSFDWIIIDAPPMLPMADVNFWSRQSDGLLLVVREGKTPKAALQKGLETLDNPTIVGVVLNDVRQAESSYYSRYYHKKQ